MNKKNSLNLEAFDNALKNNIPELIEKQKQENEFVKFYCSREGLGLIVWGFVLFILCVIAIIIEIL